MMCNRGNSLREEEGEKGRKGKDNAEKSFVL